MRHDDLVPVTRRPARPLLGALALLLAGALVVGATALDHATVASKADQADVALGLPVAWLHQDQRGADPPFPFAARLGSVWEDPTTLAAGAIVVDGRVALLVVGLLGLLGVAARRATRAVRRRRAGGQ